MKLSVIAMTSFLAGMIATAQTTNPTPLPSVQQSVSASAYPGPVLTTPAGTPVEVQFELIIGDATRIRNLIGQPISFRYFEYGGAQAAVSCNWAVGKCKISSQKPGAVRVNLSNAEGSFGYFGGSVLVNFTPAVQAMSIREAVLPVTVSTAQATEGDVAVATVTFPQDFGGQGSSVELHVYDVRNPGNDKYTYFPNGVKAGQRVEAGRLEVLPMSQAGSRSIGVELRDRYGMLIGRGDTEYLVKSGWRAFEVVLDQDGNITVSGQLPPDAQFQLALLRGDGFYLPLQCFQYQQGNRFEIVAYNGSQAMGSEYHLPAGYYSVAVIGEFPGSSGGYMRVAPNALYLDKELTLR